MYKIKSSYKGEFIHFNRLKNTMEYLKAGDTVDPTEKDLKRFSGVFEKVPVINTAPKSIITKEGEK